MSKRASLTDQPAAPRKRSSGHPVNVLLQPRADEVQEIPLDRIDPDPNQPRQHFDAVALTSLARSIEEKGVQQPIGLRPNTDAQGHFILIWGERRWRASRKAGKKTIPALVRDIPPNEAYELALIENIQRENLAPPEEAAGVARLMELGGYKQKEVAQRIGKSAAHVSKLVRIHKIPAEIREQLVSADLGLDQWYQVASQKDPDAQAKLADQITSRKMTTREARSAAKGQTAPDTTNPLQKSADRLQRILRCLRLEIEKADTDQRKEIVPSLMDAGRLWALIADELRLGQDHAGE